MTHGFLLDGKWIAAGEDISIHSPYDGAVVGTTFHASSADLETAICSSVRAFEITRKMPPFERQRILSDNQKVNLFEAGERPRAIYSVLKATAACAFIFRANCRRFLFVFSNSACVICLAGRSKED